MATQTWESPTHVVAEQVRAVAELLESRRDRLIADVNAAVLEATPQLAHDPVLAAHARASSSANVTRWVTAMVEQPEAPVRLDVPPQAVDLARDVVRRGLERDGLLSTYRTGQNVVWSEWMRAARDVVFDSDELIDVLDAGSRSLFAYIDGILAALARTMDQERDEFLDGGHARRRETVTLILDGAPISQARASARLGYELNRAHTAMIVWSDDAVIDQGELENAAAAVAGALGARRPFLVPAGTAALWAWVSGARFEIEQLRAAMNAAPAGVRVTLGSSRSGIAGFRDSHAEALAAQRLLMRNTGGPRHTTYAEVQVVSLALQDEPRAAAFIAETLGSLITANAELRETVRVYLQQDSSAPRTALLLHTHRNTILKRIARAEALLPRSLAGNGFEVRLALELLRWRGPPALSEAA
jgi:DNA-binding PucR family transcriptional regulator